MSKKKPPAGDNQSRLDSQKAPVEVSDRKLAASDSFKDKQANPQNLKSDSFTEQDYLLSAPSLDDTIQQGERRFQLHQQEAELLLASYRNGEEDAIALFNERHPEASTADFQPTLTDARLLVSRDGFQLQQLSLDRLKREAKGLLKSIQAGKEEGVVRLRAHHPKWQQLQEIKLADAQWVVARELGLPSWPRLKHHLHALTEAENQLNRSGVVIDDDPQTLHIRCGSDIQQALSACGIKGQFLEIIDPFPQGRVPPSDPVEDFAAIRAQFVDAAYSRISEEERPGESEPLFLAEERFLRSLPRDYQRICLWYEHDCFDQLSLAYDLHHLTRIDLSKVTVELIQVNQFPGINGFVGIGQLSQNPAALSLLWQNRVAVTQSMIAFADRCWRAFTEETPRELLQQATLDDAPLPVMQYALKRLIQELPWKSDGLSLTERLTLKILDRDGAMKPARAFHFLMAEAEPQAYLGDIMFLHVVLELAKANQPALNLEMVDGRAQPLLQERVVLTEAGRALLKGDLHWRDCAPCSRWLGNTEIFSGKDYGLAKNWYWPGSGVIFD